MSKNADNSLIKSINIIVIPLFIVLILAIVGTFIFQNNAQIKENVQKDSENKGKLFANLTNELQNRALESAIIISKLQMVKDAYLSENKEAAALELQRKIKPVLDEIIQENNLSKYKVHFHLPGAQSFLRVWTDKRFDDLSGFRSTVIQVENEQKPIKAIELGKGGFAIRGIAPIFNGDEYIGSVEMFYDPYDVIKSMPKSGGNAGAFFLVNAELAKSLFLESQLKENFPQQTEGFLISKINEEWIKPAEILNKDLISKTNLENQINVDMANNIGVAYIPVSDFSGKNIGIIVYLKDQSEVVKAGMNSMFLISGITAILILVILFILIGVIKNRVTKPIKEFAYNMDELAKGNIEVRVPKDYNKNAQHDELAIMNGSFERMIYALNNMIVEVNNLTGKVADGKLDHRADSSDFEGAYEELVVGVNKLSDAFIGPINVTAEYVDRISKGDIPPKITDDYKGDFNEIKNNLNQCIDVMNGLLQEVDELVISTKEGKLDARADSSKFVGSWCELVNGVNELNDAFVGPINVTAEYVDRISKGDIPPKIIDEYKGDFNEIKNNLNQCIDVMNSLLNDIDTQIGYVHEGKLDARADYSKYIGSWAKLVQGINGLNDAFTAPLNVTAEYVDRISKGDMPPKITDEYKGDFNEIKNNLNLCIDSIQNLINDANKLSDHVMHARLRERVDISKHKGDFRRIISGIHNTLDQFVGLLDNIDAPIMGIDNEFNVVFMNELGASLDGKSGKELEGVKCFNHFKTSDCNTPNCACRRAIEDVKKSASETDAHPAGLDLEIKYSGFPIKDEQGNVLGAFEIVLDQTEVKNAMKTAEKVSNFQKEESEKIINVLQSIAGGKIDTTYSCRVDDKDLEEACKNFSQISDALVETTKAIKQLTVDAESLAKEAASGNLKYRANDSIHNGEYQNIIKGVNNTLDNVIKPLNETADVLKVMSTGDLTARIKSEYKGDFIRLKSSVNALGQSLSNLINQVNDTVSTTASSAVEISSTAESLATASQEQSAQADEVASAVEEMSRTVTENAMSANKTSEMAQENSHIATEGGQVVQQTVQKMRDIAKVVENSAGNIGKLGESSKQIGEIISVIDDIADQTNLLALNAAIEAARAGEQGRGFAVVADEVRKLAERTTDATKQIADMIKGIQSETEQAVLAMNKGNDEVQSGIELADRAGQSLESILTSTQEVLDMINQIAAASEEQSATSEQISKNVVSISKVTADSTRRIEDVAHTSEDLAKLTEHLSELMGQFKVSSESTNGYNQLNRNETRQLESSY